MKTLILYYSYTGNSKNLAFKLQKQNMNTDLYEVKDVKKAGKFKTVMINCPKAAMRKRSTIRDIVVDWNKYDKLILIAPIWNKFPAPEFNSIVDALPSGKKVELYFCSAGGESDKSKEGTCKLIQQAGCEIVAYHDVCTANPKDA